MHSKINSISKKDCISKHMDPIVSYKSIQGDVTLKSILKGSPNSIKNVKK